MPRARRMSGSDQARSAAPTAPIYGPESCTPYLAELRLLCDCLAGTATLANMAGTLRLLFAGNGRGAIALTGHFNDGLHHDSRLEIGLTLDQSYLPPVLAAAHSLAEWPMS